MSMAVRRPRWASNVASSIGALQRGQSTASLFTISARGSMANPRYGKKPIAGIAEEQSTQGKRHGWTRASRGVGPRGAQKRKPSESLWLVFLRASRSHEPARRAGGPPVTPPRSRRLGVLCDDLRYPPGHPATG